MEIDTESEKLIKNLEDVNLTHEEIRLLKKIIQKSEQIVEFPKTFINKFKIFISVGFLMAFLLFISSIVAQKFTLIYGIGFLIASIAIFRIVAIKWQNDLLLPSYKFFSSAILSFSAVIIFYDSIYSLDRMLVWLFLLVLSIYALIFWIDEVYKKIKINLDKKPIDKKSVILVVSLPLIFVVLYEYASDIIIVFDTHPWLATVIMVAFSVLVTYILTRKKETKGTAIK